MLDLNEGKKAVRLAREIIENFTKHKKTTTQDLHGIFNEKNGAFVTIHTYPNHELRGCIGIPLPVMKLQDAIIEGATSATHDPRFTPLTIPELEKIIIEVTILTPPEEIEVNNPMEYLDKIKVGRDGLIAEQGFYKGLLLPQVPIEQGWDVEEFLNNTCLKAGLFLDAWHDKDIKISKFSGQVFTEVKPNGEIKEKKLNES